MMVKPKIRFKQEDGSDFPEWRLLEFEKLYKKVTEKNDLSFGRDKIISVANMYFKEDDNRDVLDDDYMRTYNIMRLGDIAFEGNKSKRFAYGRFVENTIGDGIVSHVFDVFRPIGSYDIGYWKEYINYEPIMKKVLMRCTKSSTMMTNLVANDFLKQKIFVPCISEQHRIADFISSIDAVIIASEEEVYNLELQKMAMMKKIFSQEVRFKNANGQDYPEWEDAVLGDIATAKVGRKPDAILDEETEYEYINAGTTKSGYVKSYNRVGDIVTTPSRGQGGIGFVGYQRKAFWLGPLCYGIQSSSNSILNKFIYFYLDCYSDLIMSCVKTGSIPAVNQEDLIRIVIRFPCYEEQLHISDLFSAFDEAIAAAKKELELWKELKRGLLQQMFV